MPNSSLNYSTDNGNTLVVGGKLVLDGELVQTGRVSLFDDFLGDVLEDGWSGAKGSDAQAVVPTIVAGAVDGWVRLTSGDTVVVAESAVSLTAGLQWRASAGGLVFEARVKPVSSVAAVAYFIGLTDTLATTTLEEPVTLSGTTLTTNASDAVGFVYDSDATTDVFYAIGVKADVDASSIACAAPVAETAVTLRVEVSATGTATFYQDGVLKGSLANAVTPGTALTPVVEVMTRTTAVKSLDCDYISIQKNRG